MNRMTVRVVRMMSNLELCTSPRYWCAAHLAAEPSVLGWSCRCAVPEELVLRQPLIRLPSDSPLELRELFVCMCERLRS